MATLWAAAAGAQARPATTTRESRGTVRAEGPVPFGPDRTPMQPIRLAPQRLAFHYRNSYLVNFLVDAPVRPS